MKSPHASLSVERWARYSLDQQILMIGNEMNRASKLYAPEDADRLRTSLEAVLRLTDLTIALAPRRALRRELLRWRDLVAELYVSPTRDAKAHAAAFRALLLMTKEAAKQIPYLRSVGVER